MDFLHDLRGCVIGQPEISTDGFHPYFVAIRDAFGDSASHGVIVKTYSVTHLVKEAQGRYSPAAVVAVSKEVVTGDPEQYISTSYVERQNLSLRMGSRLHPANQLLPGQQSGRVSTLDARRLFAE
jgi:hypothetical protein